MRLAVLGFMICTCFAFGFCEDEQIQPPTVSLVIPDDQEPEMKYYSASILRLGGHTEPGNRVTIDGKEIKVFPSGAFVDLISLQMGKNSILIEAENEAGKATLKKTITRQKFPGPSSTDKPVIKKGKMEQISRVGKVVENHAFLAAGLGEARLGGAQLGEVPKGVLLELNGKAGDYYRVRLSDSRIAWIDSGKINLMPQGFDPPRVLVNSGTLKGTTREDTYSMVLDSRIPYTLEPIMEPPALLLDLYGATSNLTWITQYLSAESIARVNWNQLEENHLQLRFDLTEPPIWGYGAGYSDSSNRLTVSVRKPPRFSTSPDHFLEGLTLAIDPGHGGSNRGALGCLGIEEKEVNLQIAECLSRLFEARGAKVILTRTEDVYLVNSERFVSSLEAGADFFLSIHCNSIGLSSDPLATQGASTYFRYVPYRELSLKLQEKLLDLGLKEYGNIGSFNASVLKYPDIPSVLIEIGFLSHPEDEMLLVDPSSQEKIAKAIYDGFVDFLKQQHKRIYNSRRDAEAQRK